MSKTPVFHPRRRLVAILSPSGAFAAETVDRIKVLPLCEVVTGSAESFLAGPPRGAVPDTVILDVEDGEMLDDKRLTNAREKWEPASLIVVCNELTQARMRQLVKLRVADWLQKPLGESDLLEVLSQAEGVRRAADAHVSTFIGASGGAGGTTLALMAARYLADRSAAAGETGLVDLDFHAANCGAYLNLFNDFDLDAIVEQPERLDAELLETIKREGASGIALYSFERPELFFSATGRAFVLRLLDLAAVSHKNLVIDLPNLATPWFDEVARHSDTIFIVFEINVPSLRQARQLLQRVRTARGDIGGIIAIANKSAFKLLGNSISRKDVEKIFGGNPLHTVASDAALLGDAVNRGLSPAEISRRSRMVKEASRAFRGAYGKIRGR